jgi:hypothetical protein
MRVLMRHNSHRKGALESLVVQTWQKIEESN